VRPLIWLIPGVVCLGVAKIWANDIAARGLPGINMVISLATLLVNISLNLVLIPRMGVSGAAAATTIAYVVAAFLTLIVYLRLSENCWMDTVFVRKQDVTLGFGR
jgi:O-antigen/teichoic acid export membrane protein